MGGPCLGGYKTEVPPAAINAKGDQSEHPCGPPIVKHSDCSGCLLIVALFTALIHLGGAWRFKGFRCI